MICPRCNKNNSETAKFCSGCGMKLEQISTPPVQENTAFCGNCGKPLKAGAKFCVFCGAQAGKTEGKASPAGVSAAYGQQERSAGAGDAGETVLLHEGAERREGDATVLMRDNTGDFAVSGSSAAPAAPARQAPPDTKPRKGKSNKAVIILIAAAVCMFVAAAVIAIFVFVPGMGKNIASEGAVVSDDVSDEEDEESDEAEEEDADPEEIPEEELADLGDMIARGEDELKKEHYGDEDGCLALLESAMTKCAEFNAMYAPSDDLEKTAQKAFSNYTEAILAEVELLFGQDVRPELYEQMESDINAGLEQAEKLRNAGLSIDADLLEEKMKELTDSYTDRYIERFNRFTEGATWSRTESWDLMSDADSIGLVDYGDMDDPMTQRYAYALARVTLKTVENGLSDGSMDTAAALAELEKVLKDSDYNLYLMYELANCLAAAGDGGKADTFYGYLEDITDHILETQGIYVGPYEDCDFAYDWFWSFNEFESDYSVSSENGLTKENHEWIRNYMEGKL